MFPLQDPTLDTGTGRFSVCLYPAEEDLQIKSLLVSCYLAVGKFKGMFSYLHSYCYSYNFSMFDIQVKSDATATKQTTDKQESS